MNTASNASMQMLLSVMDQAYRWLCQQRRDYSPSADVWDLRFIGTPSTSGWRLTSLLGAIASAR